jgi:hypothetical protein
MEAKVTRQPFLTNRFGIQFHFPRSDIRALVGLEDLSLTEVFHYLPVDVPGAFNNYRLVEPHITNIECPPIPSMSEQTFIYSTYSRN